MDTNRSFRITPQLVLGLIAIFLGVVFTLGNIGLIDSENYIQYWPALLIIYGIARFIQCQTGSGRVWAIAWILIGSALLLNNLRIAHIHIWDYWPLILVLVGFGMMRGSVTRRRRVYSFTAGIGSENKGSDDNSTINGVAILGGYRRSNNSQDFRGGEVTAIMGGAELDLREASIKEGEAVLDIFAFWGGVKIFVPDDWTISLQGIPILGGFEDKTRPPKTDAGKQLVIKGYAIMGGAEITN